MKTLLKVVHAKEDSTEPTKLLVEFRAGNAKVMGSISVEACFFFFHCNCLSCFITMMIIMSSIQNCYC